MYFFLFLFGLAIGSFLNVISLRYQPGQRLLDLKIINGRSHCPRCRKQLTWYELIPIFSFLFQKGKCRHCQCKLSWQYPLVEILTGLIFIFVPFSLTANGSLVASGYTLVANGYTPAAIIIWILIFLLFLLLSIIDFRHYIIPDSINSTLAVLGIILIIFQSFNIPIFQYSFLGHYALLFNFSDFLSFNNFSIFQSFNLSIFFNHLFAAFAAMIFYGLIIILSAGRGMGWGDLKLIGAIGLIFGWPDTLIISLLSFIIGSIFVLPLLIKKQKKMKDAVPFGPFIVAAATMVFFFGFQIANAYFKFFNFWIL